MFDLMPLTTAAVELARELAPAVDVMFDNAWKIRALVAELPAHAADRRDWPAIVTNQSKTPWARPP